MKKYTEKIISREDLSQEEAYRLMEMIMSGKLNDTQMAGILVALRMKGESVDEITGFAAAMRDKMVSITLEKPAIDMCGTGGDGFGTFNISTCASFVVAGAGINVAKHGNRAISSKSGSADVLLELGFDINKSINKSVYDIEKFGLGFLFAPSYHPAMKYVMKVRNSLGVRTVFNRLGPLVNPANVKAQAMGIYDEILTESQATVLKNIGLNRAMVFSGLDGLDEITTTTSTKVSYFMNGDKIQTRHIHPKDYSIKISSSIDLNGGSPKKNARIILSILQGKSGFQRDIVVLNAAAGIFVGGEADSLKDGVNLAIESIDSGSAFDILKKVTS
jgi:anthranilate phosphoribosyltransferase